MRWLLAAFAAGLLAMLPAESEAQLGVSAWVGGAGGGPTAGHAVVGGTFMAQIGARFGVAGDVAYITESPGPCAAAWPSSYRCSFRGHLATAMGRWRLLDSEQLGVDIGIGGGVFKHRDSTFSTTEPVLTIGGDLSYNVVGPVWAELRGRHYWVFDSNVRELLGSHPRFVAMLIGLGVRM